MAAHIPATPPTQDELIAELLQDDLKAEKLRRLLRRGIGPAPGGEYRHWDTVQHLVPPEGMTVSEWWLGMKFARQALYRPVPLLDTLGEKFVYAMTDPIIRLQSGIDRDASGGIGAPDVVMNSDTRDRYLITSLIEEAITSSQLEGASTTRKDAKAMLRSGRKPQTKSELMIRNNYVAMRRIVELESEPITPERLLELHRILTEGTLEDSADAGRIRTTDDIAVWGEGQQLLHRPPPASELEHRVVAMCEFANANEDGEYVHPVIRAIVLHFWLGYDHPFVDGNGRTARALFYWSMLSSGYWLTQYLSISRILNKAHAQYARSFLYTETDDNDLTYFILYHLEVLTRSIKKLYKYLDDKAVETRKVEALLRHSVEFNHRQVAVIGHALRHPMTRYTIKSHQDSHGVAYQTARTDLLGLEERGVLKSRKMGPRLVFEPVSNLEECLEKAC